MYSPSLMKGWSILQCSQQQKTVWFIMQIEQITISNATIQTVWKPHGCCCVAWTFKDQWHRGVCHFSQSSNHSMLMVCMGEVIFTAGRELGSAYTKLVSIMETLARGKNSAVCLLPRGKESHRAWNFIDRVLYRIKTKNLKNIQYCLQTHSVCVEVCEVSLSWLLCLEQRSLMAFANIDIDTKNRIPYRWIPISGKAIVYLLGIYIFYSS